MSVGTKVCWGWTARVPPVPTGRGIFLGSVSPLEGQLLEMPLSGAGGQVQGSPTCPPRLSLAVEPPFAC